MLYKELVKILESLTPINPEQKLMIELAIEDLKSTIRWNRYMLIGTALMGSGLALGFILGYFYPLSQYVK